MHSQASPLSTIESDNPRVTRAGTWLSQAANGASGGAYLYSTGNEADVLTLVFSGPSIEIVYLAGPHLGTLALEVDDTVLRTVITTADQTAYHQTTTLNYLTDEPHTLRVYAQEGGVVAVDAFRALLADDTGGMQSSLPLPPPSAYEIAYNCDGNDICLRNPLATESPVQITNLDQFIAPEWSPDGRWILYHRDVNGTLGLGLLEPNGTDRGIFTLTPPGIESRKSWSADGKKILYASEGTIYYIDLTQCPTIYQDNTNTTPAEHCLSNSVSIPLVPSPPNQPYFSDPNWHPDGRHFSFWYRNPDANNGAGQDQIYTAWLIIPSSGTAKATDVTMVSNPDLLNIDSYEHPTWSPDGSRLVVAHTHQSNEVLRMLIGTPSEPLTDEMDNYPDWSPSGTQLVYVNRPTNSLYLVPASGGSPIPLGPGTSPSWKRTVVCTIPIPDGKDGVKYYRAPITYNPYEGDLPFFSSGYQFELDAYFIDNRGTTWYRVARVLDSNNQPPTGDNPQGDAAREVEDRGGVWVKGSTEVDWPECNGDDTTPPPTMRYAHEYDIPDLDWASFTPSTLFTISDGVPISYVSLCNAVEPFSLGLEIHALGYEEPDGAIYPLDLPSDDEGGLHHGVDFFVQENTTVEVRSIGSSNGIVVGIGVGTETTKVAESHEALGTYGVGNDPQENETWYSVTVRYGHLYVLYGHLSEIPDTVWVGALVRPGDNIGTIGEQGQDVEKHLHLEVFSYEVFPPGVDATGILPYSDPDQGTIITERDIRTAFHYDFMQLVSHSSLTSAILTLNLIPPSNLTPPQVERFTDRRIAVLTFAGCGDNRPIYYQTRVPDTSNPVVDFRIGETNTYRGFHYYDYAGGSRLPSPFTIPANHP